MQLATLLIGLISATALWSGVQALNQQARTSYDRAAAIFGGARTPMLAARNGATFPQELFVDLRRAGWPVSPVLEGRIQIGGRSLPPARHRAGDAAGAKSATRRRSGEPILQSFMTPPGQMLVAPETLADLQARRGRRADGSNGGAAAAAARAAAARA